MNTVLIFCAIIATAVACPTTRKSLGCTQYPSIVPTSWKVKTFDSQQDTLAFQGVWYVQLSSITYVEGNNPLKTGLFCNTYPSTKNRLIFTDTTPCDDSDWNTEYVLCDSSFNRHTQQIENTRTLFRPAYGKESTPAIFNIGTPKYYQNPLVEKYPFIDDNLIRHKIGSVCDREYTVALIGGDDAKNEYLVFALINQYDSIIGGNDHIVWVVTRDDSPDFSIYRRAFEDIEYSKLNPYGLMSVDQSIDFTTIPSLTPDQINGIVQVTETSTTSSTSSKSTNLGSEISTSTSTSTTTEITTTSSVVIQTIPDYVSPYEFLDCDLYDNGYKILKNLDAKIARKVFSGKYFLTQTTPLSLSNNPRSRVGILNTAAPAVSLQLIFNTESIDTPWDTTTRCMGIDQGYNIWNGELQQTRFYLSSAYDQSHKYGQTVYSLLSEGYYDDSDIIDELSPLSFDGIIPPQTSDIFKKQIIFSVISCNPDEYLLISIPNKYKNPFFNSIQVPTVHAYTRDRIPSLETIEKINQELLLAGYNPNYMSSTDQTRLIEEEYAFEKTVFESTTSCWSTSSSSSTTFSETTIQSSSSKSSNIVSC